MSPVDIYLIRGLGREAGHWGDFVPALESQSFVQSVHCLDLLGTGKYRKLTSPLSIEENAEFLLSQLDESSSAAKVLLSVSMGSMVAVEMVQRQPRRFAAAFVMNTSFANLSPLLHRLQLHAFKQFLKIGRSKSLEEREREVLKMVSQASEKHERISEEWAEIARERPMAVKNFFRQLIAAARYRLADAKPDVPVLVLNSKEDKMVSPACSEALAERWQLPLHTHPSAGHDLCVDDPAWVIEVVEDELRALSAGTVDSLDQ